MYCKGAYRVEMKAKTAAMLAVLLLFAFVPVAYATASSEWEIDHDYDHGHNTAGHPGHEICGTHICKPGEKYQP